ncbi:hypothetical protein FEK30_16180 (plasmid) [Picosynechococcus sp. PCC 11901]|nr:MULTISPECIES: hypothetical protein [Cyanophyceae]QCS51051.1 hypothetical protein FEK30_16180 [Picosynechococcus sp. PCC 11901]
MTGLWGDHPSNFAVPKITVNPRKDRALGVNKTSTVTNSAKSSGKNRENPLEAKFLDKNIPN